MRPIDVSRYNAVVPLKREVEDDLLALPGVTGVDVGWKQTGGHETDRMAILVFVREKGSFAEDERIPPAIDGVPTDVIEATFVPYSALATSPATTDTARYDPLSGGCSVSPARIADGYGTLGVEVRDATSGARMLLSNWHVFCWDPDWNKPDVDKRIVQPATEFGPNVAANTVGRVTKGILGQIERKWGYDWYVDCALCDLSGGRASTAKILQIGALGGSAEPLLGELVRKRGATTQYRYGVCVSTDFTAKVDYGPGIGVVTFYYQYRFAAPDVTMPPFLQAGDSGSLAVNTENKAVGLLFAGTEDNRYATANPMYMVLGGLDISLVPSADAEQ